ncbi:gamma-secretase activating protein [Rhinolophus ferrumequinum]|uniref:Gamma-secretase activating protein n=2 Tax=Rhinolophus ferrumequinum TaxID=59479 RepID=A0A7J7TMV6_RHIFE|nr:gamma-secretase-activating protein isoform X1 [Rhinolophus ferrumequinum]KAF6301713.1 gamma-secretase activating protein [Rhinolophus ferrumequinum]
MVLSLVADFDLRKDVLPWLRAQRAASAGAGARGGGAGIFENNYESLRVLNVERNGNIIYTYKDNKGNVFFGLYDCQIRQNEHLYTFEKDLQVVSGSVNSERTLLAASLVQSTKEGRKNELQPGSKCLTLLVEIHPVNNVKVLKAVDSYIWVQFLYPHVDSHPLPENHLLLISEEKYIEQFHIQVIQEDGNKVVIKNSGHLPRERVAEDFVWAQWDMSEQRLYYIDLKKSRSILKCIQFCANENFNLMFEAPLDISLSDSGFKLVNFGCDDLQDQEKLSKYLTLCVFTNHTGSLCVCYSPKFDSWEQITYSVFYFHKGHSKTFTAALGSANSRVTQGITFLNLDYYVAVYLPGHFFHLLNIQHPDLICHSLFSTGNNEVIDMLPHSPLQSLSGSLVLDWCSGKLYRAFLNQSYLLEFLWNTQLDCEKIAVLHCVLSCGRDPQFLEAKIIQWVSENISACHSFDLIQEFIIASSYWSIYPETSNWDKLLPFSSVLTWSTEIPGITLVTEEIALPLMKVRSFQGYWEKLNFHLEYVKYSKPPLHYNNSMVWREWHSLISEEKTGKRRSKVYVRNILDNAIKVISNLEARSLEPRLTPLFQEEDNPQRLLVGLMVSELKDHLLRHLQGVEKKKIEQMALDYVSKLLDLICQVLETSWRKHNLHPWVLHFDRQASDAEFAVFHIMTRILEATNSLFLPLPPGFHTLHIVLGVHCLPLHNLLHYIDNGVLLLTETAVTRLMEDLDNTEKNEKLKFSIIVRLPPLIGQKICRLWDHPMSSNIISRNHVKRLLQNYKKQPQSSRIDKSSFSIEFLPLNYFIETLTDLESSSQALYAFEGHDNVDARFVEEAALKHTMMLLGL